MKESTVTRQASRECPICGHSYPKRLFDKDSYAVMLCQDCAVEFLHPQPDQDTLVKIYSSQYFIGAGDGEMDARVSEMKQRTAALYLDALDELRPHDSPTLLEVGCGHGDFLFEAQRRGYIVSGVEFSPSAVAKANARLGRALVQQGDIEGADLPENHFDFVIAADVVEHVRDPKAFMRRIHSLIRPNGAAVLITPSLDSLTRRLMGRHWMEYKVEHLFYFGRRSMDRLLALSGFAGIMIHPNRKILSLEYISGHFAKFPVPLVTPVLRTLTWLVPQALACRYLRVPASGMLAIGYKRYPR